MYADRGGGFLGDLSRPRRVVSCFGKGAQFRVALSAPGGVVGCLGLASAEVFDMLGSSAGPVLVLFSGVFGGSMAGVSGTAFSGCRR